MTSVNVTVAGSDEDRRAEAVAGRLLFEQSRGARAQRHCGSRSAHVTVQVIRAGSWRLCIVSRFCTSVFHVRAKVADLI
jgi:hypothetical protein